MSVEVQLQSLDFESKRYTLTQRVGGNGRLGVLLSSLESGSRRILSDSLDDVPLAQNEFCFRVRQTCHTQLFILYFILVFFYPTGE